MSKEGCASCDAKGQTIAGFKQMVEVRDKQIERLKWELETAKREIRFFKAYNKVTESC
jgi:hypothetical protein